MTDPDSIYLEQWDTERENSYQPDAGTYVDPSEDFWTARPELEHIHAFARARRAGPWAVLGVTLARVVAQTPPHVQLPRRGTLNLFVGLVGPSGGGKGVATNTAIDALTFPHQDFQEASLGSGEGLAHLYARRVRSGGVSTVEMHSTAVILDVAEVDTIAALGSRNSATILPELRKGWMGERLGFSYADPDKRLPIMPGTYRLCLTAGIQPKRAGALLDDVDGGTPQRFLWLPVNDPYAPDSQPEQPDPWEWKVPAGAEDHGWIIHPDQGEGPQPVQLDVCPIALAQLDAFRLASLRGTGDVDAIDTHSMFARLKIAAGLGLLNGHLGVTEEDWELSLLVKGQSDRQRGSVRRAIEKAAEAREKTAGRFEGIRAVVAEEVVTSAATGRVAKALYRKLRAAPGWMTSAELRRTLASRDRRAFEDAVSDLMTAGDVVSDEIEGGVRYRSV